MDKKIFPKMPYKGYKLYDASGDVTKRWFIYEVGKPRKRVYANLNTEKELTNRYLLAKKIIDELVLHETEPAPEMSVSRKVLIDSINKIADENKWSINTRYTQKFRLKKFLQFDIGAHITPSYTFIFFQQIFQKLHQTTYAGYYQIIKQVFKNAEIPVDIYFANVRKLRSNTTPYLFFSRAEHDLLKSALVDDEQLNIAVQICYYCFIRPGMELTQLLVSDFYIDENRILIRKEVGKGRRQEYAIIPDTFVETLRTYLKSKKSTDYLFPRNNDKSKHIATNFLPVKHRKILIKLGIDTSFKKLYSWKNTGAVHFLEAGGSILELQRLMRHKDIETTMGYIRDLGAEHLLAARGRMPKW